MSEILKPCPFCEGEAKEFKDTLVYTSVPNGAQYIVWCTKCGCRSPMNIENKEEAIKAWNKRPNPWHTGTPTEDGDYLLRTKILNLRYDVAHYKDGKFMSYHGYYFNSEHIIEWQKIELNKASEEKE